MFINDYRPTKRVGIEELDGCIKLFGDKVDEARSDGLASIHHYEGALLALSLIRNGKFEYPRDFLAVFENKLGQPY